MRRLGRSLRLRVVLSTAAAALLFVACGGGEPSEGEAGAEGAPAAAPSGEATRVTVEETEFALALSQTSFPPGTYTFVAKNAGALDHALEIEGPGLKEETSTLAPGGSGELTVELKEGTYELYCPVDGHADQGMRIKIQVGAGAPPAETSPPTPAGGGYGSGYSD